MIEGFCSCGRLLLAGETECEFGLLSGGPAPTEGSIVHALVERQASEQLVDRLREAGL